MSATTEQRKLLDLLDICAILADVQRDLRDVITRIANRAKTADEADDLRILIDCRRNIETAQTHITRLHPDHRTAEQ